MLTVEEKLISEARLDMNIGIQLDHFQIQAILGLINDQNVVVRTPTGSGKSINFHSTVSIDSNYSHTFDTTDYFCENIGPFQLYECIKVYIHVL